MLQHLHFQLNKYFIFLFTTEYTMNIEYTSNETFHIQCYLYFIKTHEFVFFFNNMD